MICPECGAVMKERRAGRPDTCLKCGHKAHSTEGAAKPAKKKAAKKKAAKKKVKKKP